MNNIYSLEDALEKVKTTKGIKTPDPWDIVNLFEEELANYCGAKYAVALDSCTNGLFLCLKYKKIKNTEITIPENTYLSVPQLILHSGNTPCFKKIEWSGSYELGNTGIFDSAGRIKKNMYKRGTFSCVSFHRKKCVNIGKGGMILTDDNKAYEWMQKAVYEGRDRRQPHDENNFARG